MPFAQVGQLDISVKLFPLLTGNVEVDSLEMKQAKIELIRNAQGVWNFSTAGSAPAATSPATPPAPSQPAKQAAPSAPSGQQFTLGELKITDGQIAITDYQKHQSRAVYDHIDVTLKDYAPGSSRSPLTPRRTCRAAARKPCASPETAARSTMPTSPATPFKGTVKLDQVSLSAAQKFLNTAALEGTDAVISGSTNLTNANGKMAADGSLKLDNAVIHGVKVGYPISADFDVTDDLTSDVIQIRKGALKLGSTPLSLNGTMNTRPNPSVVDVNVSTSNASIRGGGAIGVGVRRGLQPEYQDRGTVDRQRACPGSDRSPGAQRQRQRTQPGSHRKRHSAAGARACD